MEGLEMYVRERAFARHLKGPGSNSQHLSPQRNTEKPTYLYIVYDCSLATKTKMISWDRSSLAHKT